MSPDYTRTNPYQELLAGGLRDHGVDVEHVAIHGPLMPVKALRERGVPDAVHFHWLHPFLLGRSRGFTGLKAIVFFAQVLLLRLLGVRIIWTAHNITEHDPRHPALERALKHLFVRCTDAVIIHCEMVADRLLDAYHLPDHLRERLHAIPHGHYCDVYENEVSRERARSELGLTDEFTFLFFGRVCAYKNITGLVAAFQALDVADARLVIAGNPENEAIGSEIKQAVAQVDRAEAFLQFVPEERIQYYMNAADVVVLPFREILTSGSAILAMSFGKPVVVPEAGCVATVIPDDGGYTYQETGRAALRRALARTMDADLDAVGDANRAAVQEFDWDGIARRTVETYLDG